MSVGDRVGPDLFGLTERRERDGDSAHDHGEAGHGHAAGSHGEARKM